MGAVLPPGIVGGGPPWNGASLSFFNFAGPNDFCMAPAPGGGGGPPPEFVYVIGMSSGCCGACCCIKN